MQPFLKGGGKMLYLDIIDTYMEEHEDPEPIKKVLEEVDSSDIYGLTSQNKNVKWWFTQVNGSFNYNDMTKR